MGDLIVMTPTKKISTDLVPPAARGAEILFFTGVRYYRMTEETLPVAAAPKRSRRTSALEPKTKPKTTTMIAVAKPLELQA